MQLSAIWPELCYLQISLTSAAVKSLEIAKALMNEYERGTNVKSMKDQHVAGNRTANDNQRTNYWENTGKKKSALCGVLELTQFLKCEGKGTEWIKVSWKSELQNKCIIEFMLWFRSRRLLVNLHRRVAINYILSVILVIILANALRSLSSTTPLWKCKAQFPPSKTDRFSHTYSLTCNFLPHAKS